MRRIVGLAIIGWLAAIPGSAQTSGALTQELTKVETAWKDAVVNRDKVALQRLYADEYVSTDSEGQCWNKVDDIEIDTSGGFRLESYKFDDLKVHAYADVAVVTGRSLLAGANRGQKASASFRFTDVFVKRDGRWQLVTTQLTPLSALP